MVHFINKIIEANGEDLSKDPSVHYKFTRFSKGKFHGPVLKITRRGKTITIKGSLDYEDSIRLLVISLTPDGGEGFMAKGKIEAFEDPTDFLNESVPVERFGEDVRVKEKSSKNKQMWEIYFSKEVEKGGKVVEVEIEWQKEDLSRVCENFLLLRGYNLLKMKSLSSPEEFTVKTRVPRSDGEYKIDKITGFCTGKIKNNEENWDALVKLFLPDMGDPGDVKIVIVEHDYDITEIAVPPDAEGNKRLAAVRKGTITRKVTVDGGEPVTKEYTFLA